MAPFQIIHAYLHYWLGIGDKHVRHDRVSKEKYIFLNINITVCEWYVWAVKKSMEAKKTERPDQN